MEGIQQLLEFAMEINQSGSLEEITMAFPIILTKAMTDAQRRKMEE